jgi:hypothetical protein
VGCLQHEFSNRHGLGLQHPRVGVQRLLLPLVLEELLPDEKGDLVARELVEEPCLHDPLKYDPDVSAAQSGVTPEGLHGLLLLILQHLQRNENETTGKNKKKNTSLAAYMQQQPQPV